MLTIDPARRLANALGLASLGNVETRIDPERLDAAGIRHPTGQLWAMMLDAKRTWDDLVIRFARDPAQARRILANHYYQQISSALAGSQEFMAMEKLYELHESGRYEVLVLDTPPTRHALDFLDAPKKMMGLLDEGVLRLFLDADPHGREARLRLPQGLERPDVRAARAHHRLRGAARYLRLRRAASSGMYTGFRDRARRGRGVSARGRVELRARRRARLRRRWRTPNSSFGRLAEYRLPFGGFIVNRVHADALGEAGAADAWRRLRARPDGIFEALGVAGGAALAERLAANFDRVQALADQDAARVDRLERTCPASSFLRATFPRSISTCTTSQRSRA